MLIHVFLYVSATHNLINPINILSKIDRVPGVVGLSRNFCHNRSSVCALSFPCRFQTVWLERFKGRMRANRTPGYGGSKFWLVQIIHWDLLLFPPIVVKPRPHWWKPRSGRRNAACRTEYSRGSRQHSCRSLRHCSAEGRVPLRSSKVGLGHSSFSNSGRSEWQLLYRSA